MTARSLRDHECPANAVDHSQPIVTSTGPGAYEVLAPDLKLLATIKFQDGVVSEVGINGVTIEALLAIVVDRLREFQAGPFACRENALALTKSEEVLLWLHRRTTERRRRGVEGRYKS